MKKKAAVRVDKFKYYDLVIYAARDSSGARRLSSALGARRWRDDLPERYTRRRPYFKGNSSPLVVNWGSTIHPSWLEDKRFHLTPIILNAGSRVKEAIDKRTFFQKASGLDGVPLLRWTSERERATKWLIKGYKVICRTNLTASSGKGIILVSPSDEAIGSESGGTEPTSGSLLVEAPLYTRYYPKTHEFRVHVFNGKVIDFTEKKFRGGVDARSQAGNRTIIRSHDNGWVHAHENISLSVLDCEELGRSCVALVSGFGLSFGAVDVLAILEPPDADRKRRLKSFVVCEVNTGPGLENTKTIEAYSQAILAVKNGEDLQVEVK